MKDKRTPLIAKIMIVLTISYAVSPIDLIPDFIPVLGYLDDLIILPIMITISIKLIPKEVFEDCRIKAREKIRISKRFGILSALIIILLWVALIIYLVSVFAS
ncbi:MAG: YkvA family protein [Bacteroidales bacterium]|nr:YkvA family protein [Bacteroidales bacterium]